jgi:DHA1 family inner membrane transport protein
VPAATPTAVAPAPVGVTPRGAAVVGALALGAFAFVTTENLPIGLLPLIAADLERSLSAVGLLVTGYGLTVAVVSVPLTRLTLRIPRRFLLSGLLTVFVLATLLSVASSTYWLLLVARVITALAQSVFWGVLAATASGLFPPRIRSRVIAVAYSGGSLAAVLGVPAGTWLGQQAGWRAAFVALSGLGLLALVSIATLLPTTPAGQGHSATGSAPDRRRFVVVLTVTALAVTGLFTAYTYVVAFLTEVSGFALATVSLLLLIFGAAGVFGTLAAGALADRHPRPAMIVPVATAMAALAGLYLFGAVQPAAVGLVGLTGMSLAAVPTAMQSRIMHIAPGSTEIASAANGAAFNAGIASGALLGGVLLPVAGVRATPLVGAALLAAALAVLLSEPLLTRPAADGPLPTRPGRASRR